MYVKLLSPSLMYVAPRWRRRLWNPSDRVAWMDEEWSTKGGEETCQKWVLFSAIECNKMDSPCAPRPDLFPFLCVDCLSVKTNENRRASERLGRIKNRRIPFVPPSYYFFLYLFSYLDIRNWTHHSNHDLEADRIRSLFHSRRGFRCRVWVADGRLSITIVLLFEKSRIWERWPPIGMKTIAPPRALEGLGS